MSWGRARLLPPVPTRLPQSHPLGAAGPASASPGARPRSASPARGEQHIYIYAIYR